MSEASFCVDETCLEQGPRHLHKPSSQPNAVTAPLTRTCPKCRSAMRAEYHDSREPCMLICDECHKDDGCPGGRTEHLLWTCTCGFTKVTPCADADRMTP